MRAIAENIRQVIVAAKPKLSNIAPEHACKKETPGSWSKQEILGHLIDSASNNHQRFVRGAQNLAGDFPTYQPNRWVEIQAYNDMNWPDIVELFSCYNLHLCRVIDALPQDVLHHPCHIGRETPVTLQFVIEDYLRHLRHHLETILGPLEYIIG
jgi:hypothetical protein